MKESLLLALLSLGAFFTATAQIVYADFESAGLTFQGLDGVLTAPVANPGANQINASANCAQYVKSNLHAYSLLLAESATPFNLTTNNQFKIHIYAKAPTQILMKLEGTGGAAEVTRNIAVVDAWQEYTFDFSAQAANTGLTKIILFFDPGVDASGDTYYFDNLSAGPNPCTDAPPADMLDDFECARNATYALGWDSLHVVNNPAPNADNPSAKVGKFNDQAGDFTEYGALVIDFQNPIDLAVNNHFSCQVRAPKTGTLLLKIEGGVSAAETAIQVTEINKWVTYTANFSAEAGEGHRKLVFFFNAGVNGAPGDVYYIDNVRLSPPPPVPALEDFEGGLHLGWQALDQNATFHGIFTGPTANPAPGQVNTSAEVGCYKKGSAPFSTLQAILAAPLDLTNKPQFSLDVLSPANGTKVRMQLNSATQGNKEVEALLTAPGEWETLLFDFSPFSDITDFGEIRILFNPGAIASGQTWYLDNLRQGVSTVDPCVDVVAVPNIVDDFECQRNYTQIFYGGADISVVNNPQLAPENGSLKVGKYVDPAGAGTEFAGIGFEFPSAPDLSVYNHLQLQVWSPTANVPFLFKLEGGSQAVEIFDTLTAANTWHKFDLDFTAAQGKNNTKLVIFTNVLSATGGGTYFFDNIKWQRDGYNGCIIDHQAAATTLSFAYFANGHLETEGYQFEVVNNPKPLGINTSGKVGKFVKASDGLPFAGMYSKPDLDASIDWKGVKTVRAKVLMDHIGNFAVKVEGSATGAPAFEIPVANTKVNEWEELTFNFAAVPDNGEYKRLTLFFDLPIDATGVDVTSYFDDIIIGNGECLTVGSFEPTVAALRVFPNPASTWLRVENTPEVAQLVLYDLLSRRLLTVSVNGDLSTDLDLSNLLPGLYTLAAYDSAGRLLANGKVVKE